MDINDSNNKSQQTGGLKLMTVFIAVLALHVVVIGGFTVYHLMSGGSTDTDMTAGDKTHKGLNGTSMTESTMPDATQGDKTTPPTEVATIPATTVTPAPTPDATASTAVTPAPDADATAAKPAPVPATTPAATADTTSTAMATSAPASAPAVTTPTTAPTPPSTSTSTTETSEPASGTLTDALNPGPQAPTGPIAPELAPPPDAAPVSAPAPAPVPVPPPAPASSFASGPVHMPPPNISPDAPRLDHEHMQIYIVKITDSYKKIAHRHHVTVAQLKEANHITGNVLHTGQKLYIPSEKTDVAERASTSTLDAAPNVNESAAPMTTGLTSTSTTLGTTSLHHHLYTVVKGDTLTRIAHRYKTTASAIMAENGITDPTKLSIGKKLRIPSSGETRSARNNPPASTQPQVQAKTGAPSAQLANYGN